MNVLRGKESRRRMGSESGLLYALLGYDTADSQVDLHRLTDRRNNVPGLFMPCIFRSRVPFPALAALRIHHDFARQPAGSGNRSAAKMLTPASKTRATAIGFHSGFILRLPFMRLCG